MKIIKNNLPLILILLFAAAIRLLFLNFIPTGMTNDELHFILNAKSVWFHFTDLSGQWNPLSLQTIPGEASSELTFILLAPFAGLLPTNLFTARLPFVLISLATTFLIYLIIKKLFNQKTALIVAFVYAVNPWSIYVSRTSFDAPIANFFYILTFYLILKLKNWKILLAFIPAFFAFYTYIGTKVILVPFIMICSAFGYFYTNHRKYMWPYLSLIFLSLALTLFFTINLSHQPTGARMSELTNPNSQQVIDQVDIERNLTFNTPLKKIFSNRYLFYVTKFSQKYLNSFSPDVLFLHGDPTYLVSLWKHGYFYLIDCIFIILGLCYLYSKSKPLFCLLLSIILIAPIPEAIRSDTIPAYAFHSSLQFPFLAIICGLGIVSLWQKKFIIPIITVYLISFLNFFNIYFFQYPLYQPEGFNFSRQIVSQYLKNLPTNKEVYVLSHEPESMLRNYLFYSNNRGASHLHFAKNFPNITSNDLLISQKEIIPVIFPQKDRLSINNLSNNLEVFSIFNDNICQNIDINQKLNFSDLNLSSLSPQQLCQKYFY